MNDNQTKRTVLELVVKNHAGVMSHVCGLFARRAYNVDAIVCLPLAGGEESRIWLRVDATDRLPQITAQVEKLQDVQEVKVLAEDGVEVFRKLEEAHRNR